MAVAAGLGLLTACGGGPSPQPDSTPGTLPSPPATTTAPSAATAFATEATLTIGLAGEPANWNPVAASPPGPDPALALVAEAVLPSASAAGPGLVTSVTETPAGRGGAAPQSVVYQLDPRARWSDGVAITAADFAYTWEAQSGQTRFRDRNRRRFTPTSTAGYRQISSVTATAGDADRVTVRFATPDPDWRSLFDPVLAAHTARAVGFDHGFTDPVTSLVSGGPFLVQSYQPGADVVLVRNPRWWGPAAALATLQIDFVDSAAVAAASLEQGQLDAGVSAFTPATVAALRATPGLRVSVGDEARYDDLVFDERSGPLAVRAVRLAVMLAVDRPAASRHAMSEGDTAAAPVGNRAFTAGSPGYRAQRAIGSLPALDRARAVLAAAGYRWRGSTLTLGATAVRLTLAVETPSPLAAAEEAAIVRGCDALGMAVTVRPAPTGATPTRRAPRQAGMTLAEVAITGSAAALEDTYASGGGANRSGYSSPVMDGLLARLATGRPGAERRGITDQVDALAWTDAVDLPMLGVPQVLTVQSRYANLTVAPSASGVSANESQWGIPQPP